MSMEAPIHGPHSPHRVGDVEKNRDTCRRLGRCCFSGIWHLPFIPQIVESRASLGSLSCTTPNFPKAMPLGQRCSVPTMESICSTKLFSISCSIRALVFSDLSLALDQLPSQTKSSCDGFEIFGLGSQRPTDCSGEKAPVGMPYFRRDAISESGSSDRSKREWKI